MSEPVPTGTTATPDFAAFEAAENAKALGQEPPKASEPAPVAEPVDAEDGDGEPLAEVPTADPVAANDAATAPTPEKPISKRQQQINDLIRERVMAEQRARQLEARIAELEKARTTPAEPATPATAAVDPSDPEPTVEAYDDYAKYIRDLTRWEVRQERRQAEATAKANASQKAADERIQTWVQRRDAFAATEPRFAEAAYTFLSGVTPGTPLGDVLMDSPVGPQLALHLAEHPEDVTRIWRLTPIQQIRELGKLEARIETDTVTRTSASAGPAAKTVTTAPAPPTTLAARSADPADPVAAAVARGDFRAFEEAENRKALAAAR